MGCGGLLHRLCMVAPFSLAQPERRSSAMLKMQMPDGTSIIVTGDEAKKAVGAFEKVISDHSRLVEISRVTKSIKKDTSYLVKAIPEEVKDELDEVEIKGERLKQFRTVKQLLSAHPTWSINRACNAVWTAGKGYPSVKSLHRYCLAHKRKLYM